MITVTYSNGVVLSYDETLKEGDLITAYKSGYYTFKKYEIRGPNTTPLAYIQKKYRDDGTLCKSFKIETCDASYCQHALQPILKEIAKREEEIKKLKTILESIVV